jgi:eukaryotic-like serine/threonine-protein kinase
MSDPACHTCGTVLAGSGSVEGLCSGCLLLVALRDPETGADAAAPSAPTPGSSARREPSMVSSSGRRPSTLEPMGLGIAAPHWTMPADLLRQAARRLAVAAFGFALTFAGSIIANNLVAALGWVHHSHLNVKNVSDGVLVALSAAMAYAARTGALAPRRLLVAGLVYEVVIALAISIGDHLEPMSPDLPLQTISWLCLMIAIFPLVVPAPSRWTLIASLAAATTWPIAYAVGVVAGNPPAPFHVAVINSLEAYVAVGFALFTTFVIRRLQELGCYQLVERLDKGGMGEIWRARHRMLARPVAVKLIRADLLGARTPTEAAALVGRFQREAEATAALHSAHTVALHDFGVTPEGVFYYAMELLDGLDLDTVVRRFGPVPPERAIHLLTQACESLEEAHSQGLIHRDVKPANIVTCHWGHKWDFVKVLDFGLVKAAWSLGDDDRLTTEGVITGTPAFLAPEAALGRRDIDHRVDIYGLGCVAYWLLTGRRPFEGTTPMEMVLHHVKTPPVPPSQRVDTPIPAALEGLVLSCLAKEPEARPPSAEWLGEELARCVTSRPWTPGRARQWWDENAGDATARAAAPTTPTV